MARVRDGPVAGDALALPLVEGIQLIGIVTHAPLLGIQVPPLIKLVPQVVPVSFQNLCDGNGKSVRTAAGLPPALLSVRQGPTTETRLVPASLAQRWARGRTLIKPSAT